MQEMVSVQWILKGKETGDGGKPVRNCRFKTDDLGEKNVEKELTRSLFSASVHVLLVGWACNSSLTVRQCFAADSLSHSSNLFCYVSCRLHAISRQMLPMYISLGIFYSMHYSCHSLMSTIVHNAQTLATEH